jgi:hypothetical protein
MTGFTGYIDFIPGSIISPGTGIVLFPDIGGMAFRAHIIPVLSYMRPVQHILRGNAFLVVNMEPALSALLCRTCIPAEGQHLVSPSRELNKVLLQRPDAKNIRDPEIAVLTVYSLGIDHKFPALPEKPGVISKVINGKVIKISEDGLFIRNIHGHIVVRTLEEFVFPLMTFPAGFPAYITFIFFSG